MQGMQLDMSNPPASVFRAAAGDLGYRFFGVVMWCAAITSVVGAAYTSVSFLKTFHPWIANNERWLISGFIVFSTAAYVFIGNPVKILVTVGALNGLILPIALAIMLVVSHKTALVGTYKHATVLTVVGWLVVIVMSYMGGLTIRNWMMH